MKKNLLTLLGWVLTPALLVGHHLTQHNAFLYVVGLTAVLAVAVSSIVVVFALFHPEDETIKKLEREFAAYGSARMWISGAFTLAIIFYLLAVEAYVTGSLYIFGSIFSLVTISFFKQGIAEKIDV